MADSSSPSRPRQVTLSGWLILIGSVVVVVMAFQQVSAIGSTETQEAAADVVAGGGESVGLTVDDVQLLLRVMSYVAAACAAATAILGQQVLMGSTQARRAQARLALSILAPLLFVAGAAPAGLPSAVVAAAVVILWMQPARPWFAPASSGPAAEAFAAGPPSVQGHGSGGGSPAQHQTPAASGWSAVETSQRPPAAVEGRPAGRRPGQVVAACVTTFVFCGLAVAVMAVTAVTVASAPDQLMEQLRQQRPDLTEQAGVTQGTLIAATLVVAALIVAWCVVAAVLAVLALRRVHWAAIALLVSSGLAAGLSLLASLGSPVAALPLLGCLLVMALLTRPEVRLWYAAQR